MLSRILLSTRPYATHSAKIMYNRKYKHKHIPDTYTRSKKYSNKYRFKYNHKSTRIPTPVVNRSYKKTYYNGQRNYKYDNDNNNNETTVIIILCICLICITMINTRK